MYTNFYGLEFKPFDLLPDPRFLFLSKEHDLALTHLEYGITDNKGFIVLTGEIGAGKTTLLNYMMDKIEEDVNTALLFNTNLDPASFLEMVVKEFGIKKAGKRISELYDSLYKFLLDEHVKGKRSILVIDEAQNLPLETLEELRMLSNFETQESYLLQIIVAGQPQLRSRLGTPELAQLTQRVSVFYHLAPLDTSEVNDYITYRLKVAGYQDQSPLFTEKAVQVIGDYAKGIPRIISALCDTALTYGYADEVKPIDQDVVEKVIEDRGLVVAPAIGASDNRAFEDGSDTVVTAIESGNGNKIDQLYKELSFLNERLARSEQKIEELSNIRAQAAIDQLVSWLKDYQNKYNELQEKYNNLLHRLRKVIDEKNKLVKEVEQPKPKKGLFSK